MNRTNIDQQYQIKLLSLVGQLTESLVIITNPAEEIEWVNAAFEKRTGYSFEEARGKNPRFLQGEDTSKIHRQNIREAIDQRRTITQEILNYTKDGMPYWIMINVTPVFDENNTLKHFISVEQDITEARTQNEKLITLNAELRSTNEELQVIEEELRSSNEQLTSTMHRLELQVIENEKLIKKQQEQQRLLWESKLEITKRHAELKSIIEALHFSSIISMTDKEGKIIEMNDKFCEISGYNRNELLGKNHNIVNSGYHPKSFWAEMWKRIAQGKFWRGEICNRAKDGSLYWVYTSISPLIDEKGKIYQYISIRNLITKRKNQEKQLQQLTDNLQATLDNSTNAIALYDLEGNLILADRKLKNLAKSVLGFDLENQHNIFKVVEKGENYFMQRLLEYYQRACIGEGRNFTRKIKNKWYDITFNPIVETDGIVNGVVYSILDITQHREMQEQLVTEHQNLESLVNTLNDMVFQIDGRGKFLNIWTSNEDQLLVPKEEALGKTILEIVGEEAGKPFMEAIELAKKMKTPQIVEYQHPDDPNQYYSAKFVYGYQTTEGADRITVLVEDISLRKSNEQKIAEQSKKIAQLYAGVMSSINYARRIQTALLPRQDEMKHAFSENFVYYRPKNIVSGDFYWVFKKMGTTFLATADCTGHGVPGAFMSMIGVEALNKIVTTLGILSPEFILYELHRSIRQTLRYTADKPINDGMDISICVFEKDKHKIQFAGAVSSIYLVQKGTISEYRGNGYPIGGFHKIEDRIFNKHTIDYQKGNMLYTTTDGYKDQFGEKNREKFKSFRFKELLLSIANLPVEDQMTQVEKNMDEWRGNTQQIDDMLVIGIRLLG